MNIRPEITLRASEEQILVVKTYPEAESERAVAEIAWLRAAGDVAGVVQLVDSTSLTVITRHAGGSTLRSNPPEPTAAAGFLSQVATTIDELQRRQLHHGAVSLDHVVIGALGALLCGPSVSIDPGEPDLVGLGKCCEELVANWIKSEVEVPHLALWQQLTVRLCEGDETLSAAKAAATLSSISTPPKEKPRRQRLMQPRRSAVVVGTVLMLATVLVILLFFGRPSGKSSPDHPGPELVVGDNLLMIGRLGGEAALIEPRCGGQPAVVLLDGSRRIWTFSSAVAGERGTVRAQIPGATGLKVENENGCAVAWAIGPAGEIRLDLR